MGTILVPEEQVVEVARWLYEKGLATAYEGNVSLLDGERVYITPSAQCKGFLTPEMIVRIDLQGDAPPQAYRASSELKLHLCVYKSRADVRAVVHAHSPYATAFAIAGREIISQAYPEMMMLYDRIPIARYGTPSTDAVCADVPRILASYDVFLLANHGIVAVGASVREAFFRLESVEAIAKVLYLAQGLGGEKSLPPDEVERLGRLYRQGKRT